MSFYSVRMSRHFYLVVGHDGPVLFSNVAKAKAYADDFHRASVWEFFDNGCGGALECVLNGKRVVVYDSDFKKTRDRVLALRVGTDSIEDAESRLYFTALEFLCKVVAGERVA